MKYRVDNVPWPWKPLWLAFGWILGVAWWLLFQTLNLACRIRIVGRESIGGGTGFIYSVWHTSWLLWFVVFVRSHRRHVWMQHHAAYMKPVHVALRLMGIRIILGSGGEEGRAAVDRLAECLRSGHSTAISPDGPAGPPGVLKKGVLHLALKSGVPVVPVRLSTSAALTLPTWDRKRVPLPFSRITVRFGEPVTVTEDALERAAEIISRQMT